MDVVQRVLQHFAFPLREGREGHGRFVPGSPSIPGLFLGATQDSSSKAGSSAEAPVLQHLADAERENHGEGRSACPELHHMAKGSGAVTPGAELKHVLKNPCSLNLPRLSPGRPSRVALPCPCPTAASQAHTGISTHCGFHYSLYSFGLSRKTGPDPPRQRSSCRIALLPLQPFT